MALDAEDIRISVSSKERRDDEKLANRINVTFRSAGVTEGDEFLCFASEKSG